MSLSVISVRKIVRLRCFNLATVLSQFGLDVVHFKSLVDFLLGPASNHRLIRLEETILV